MHESAVGTKLSTRDIRYTAAIGGKPDMTWTAQFGRGFSDIGPDQRLRPIDIIPSTGAVSGSAV